MDTFGISYCAQNKKGIKFQSFLPAASIFQQSQQIRLQDGKDYPYVQLNTHKIEKNCTPPFEMKEMNYTGHFISQRIHNLTAMNSQTRTFLKSDQFMPRKDIYGQHQFPVIQFSTLVGGFVGSKSQVGSVRDPCQVWDVVLRKLMDFMTRPAREGVPPSTNKNPRHCCGFDEALSSNTLGSLCQESATYLCESCKLLQDPSIYKHSVPPKYNSLVPEPKKEVAFPLEPAPLPVKLPVASPPPVVMIKTPKQSYADVARLFARSQKPTTMTCEHKSYNRPPFNHNGGNYSRRYCKPSTNSSSNWRQVGYQPDPHGIHNHERRAMDRMHDPSHYPTRQEWDGGRNGQASTVQGSPRICRRNWGYRKKDLFLERRITEDTTLDSCSRKGPRYLSWRTGKTVTQTVLTGTAGVQASPPSPGLKCKEQPDKALDCRISSESQRERSLSESSLDRKRNARRERSTSECSSVEGGDNLRPDCMEMRHSLSSLSEDSLRSDCSELRRRVSSECSIDSEDSFVVFEDSRAEGLSDLDSDGDWSECDPSDEEDVDEVDQTDSEILPHPMQLKLQDINTSWQQANKDLPRTCKSPQKLQFVSGPGLVCVHRMVSWGFAYRAARLGPWEEMARDRARFRARLECTGEVLAPVLSPQHRCRIWEERFTPK